MLVVNARFITQPTSGVQRFAESVAAQLLEQRDDVVLVAPVGARPRADGPLADAAVTHVGRSSGHRWEQVDLPLHLHRTGRPLLLGLTNTNPVAYRNMISTHHDVTYLRHPESYSWAFRTFYATLAPRLLRNSRRILTVSEFSRQDIATAYGTDTSKINVVYNAADFPAASTSPSDGTGTFFLSVSSQNRHKNLSRLIEAFAMFRAATKSETKLLLVGDRSAVFSDHDTWSRHTEGVSFTGRVTDAALRDLYGQAKAFVFPSLYEGFGIPPIEAQAIGVPVLSSDAASLPEVLGDSALYFNPLDVSSIAAALTRIDGDAALRAQLAESGSENARRFSWVDSAKTVSDIADALISSS